MCEAPPTRRRWFQFSLRTLFVVVTVLGVFIVYHVNWIRQRDEARDWLISSGYGRVDSQLTPPEPCTAPWGLRILFEGGESIVVLRKQVIPANELRSSALRMKSLFPEALVSIHDQASHLDYPFEE